MVVDNEVFVLEEINLPKTNRGQETLAKISKAAEDLFSKKGYYNTSITDITHKADVAPGTFYIYFKDKKSVFRFLVEELSHTLRREIANAVRDCKTRFDAEYVGFRTFFNFVKKHRGLYKIIWEAQFVDDKLFREYYSKVADGYIEGIKQAQAKGEVGDLDPEALVYCLNGISKFMGLRWVIWENKGVPEGVFESIVRFIKAGAFKDK